MKMKSLRSMMAATAFASAALVTSPAHATGDGPDHGVTLGGCFRIELRWYEYDDYGQSTTFKYAVREKSGCKDLSNWVLSTPGCKILGASPEPWERVFDEPHTHLTGIKWETGDGFSRGTFTVTVKGLANIREVDVAAKAGPDVFFGKIAGPKCHKH